jgi:hypothetical protein
VILQMLRDGSERGEDLSFDAEHERDVMQLASSVRTGRQTGSVGRMGPSHEDAWWGRGEP